MTYWIAPPWWKGGDCIIVCGGPSLFGFDFGKLRGRNIIAINSSYRDVPFAQALVFGDDRWWDDNSAEARKFKGAIVTVSNKQDHEIKRMKKAFPVKGPSPLANTLAMEKTTLTAAMNLALHFGVSKMVLIGADMGRDAEGRSHHHAPHRTPPRDGCWEKQMVDLATFVKPLKLKGVEVLNGSPKSLMEFWPRMTMDEALA